MGDHSRAATYTKKDWTFEKGCGDSLEGWGLELVDW